MMRGGLGAIAIAALAACTSHVGGSMTVDGQPFAVSECRSGAAFSFSGIQFADATGKRLRLMQEAGGGVTVALFQPGAPRGDTFGACGTIQIETQNSTINNIRNVKGKVDLSCEGGGHKLVGSLSFENCH